jgi:hypothetical protein
MQVSRPLPPIIVEKTDLNFDNFVNVNNLSNPLKKYISVRVESMYTICIGETNTNANAKMHVCNIESYISKKNQNSQVAMNTGDFNYIINTPNTCKLYSNGNELNAPPPNPSGGYLQKSKTYKRRNNRYTYKK